MRVFPDEWDPETILLEITQIWMRCYEVYGMLKTHDLKMHQRTNMKGNKEKFVVLNAESKLINMKETSIFF